MKTRTCQVLYNYWNDVRGGRRAPRRFEIEPGRISELLPETFILERRDPFDIRYRLAGTRICETFGSEFRGTQFLDGWSPADRLAIERQLVRVVSDCAVGVFSFEATSTRQRAAGFEVVLLPLTHMQETVDRILGSIVVTQQESWLGSEPLLTRALRHQEIIWPDGEPAPADQRPDRQVPFPLHVRHARIVRSNRRQFRVYDGGLSK